MPAALSEQPGNFPQRFKDAMGEVIIGQQQVLELLVTALLCDGHVLLTGVPGLAKTMLVRCLAGLFQLFLWACRVRFPLRVEISDSGAFPVSRTGCSVCFAPEVC